MGLAPALPVASDAGAMAVGLSMSPARLVTDAIHCGRVSFCLSAAPPRASLPSLRSHRGSLQSGAEWLSRPRFDFLHGPSAVIGASQFGRDAG